MKTAVIGVPLFSGCVFPCLLDLRRFMTMMMRILGETCAMRKDVQRHIAQHEWYTVCILLTPVRSRSVASLCKWGRIPIHVLNTNMFMQHQRSTPFSHHQPVRRYYSHGYNIGVHWTSRVAGGVCSIYRRADNYLHERIVCAARRESQPTYKINHVHHHCRNFSAYVVTGCCPLY